MDTLYFFILVLTVLVLAYKRMRLIPAMTLMIVLTVVWTELRHLFYVPSWFRFGNGIVAVTLIGFAIGPLRRLLISDRLYTLFRREIGDLAGIQSDAVGAPVLISAGVLEVEDVLVGVCPGVDANSPACVSGHGPRLLRRIDRCHPHIQHPIARGKVRQVHAVRTDPDEGSVWIAEQNRTRNQLGMRHYVAPFLSLVLARPLP